MRIVPRSDEVFEPVGAAVDGPARRCAVPQPRDALAPCGAPTSGGRNIRAKRPLAVSVAGPSEVPDRSSAERADVSELANIEWIENSERRGDDRVFPAATGGGR